jgi:hypothetical protein
MVASHLALWAAGGERAEDFDCLREDRELVAHALAGLAAARALADFHRVGVADFEAEGEVDRLLCRGVGCARQARDGAEPRGDQYDRSRACSPSGRGRVSMPSMPIGLRQV